MQKMEGSMILEYLTSSPRESDVEKLTGNRRFSLQGVLKYLQKLYNSFFSFFFFPADKKIIPK